LPHEVVFKQNGGSKNIQLSLRVKKELTLQTWS